MNVHTGSTAVHPPALAAAEPLVDAHSVAALDGSLLVAIRTNDPAAAGGLLKLPPASLSNLIRALLVLRCRVERGTA